MEEDGTDTEDVVFSNDRSEHDRPDDPALLKQIVGAKAIHLHTVQDEPILAVSFSTYGDSSYIIVNANPLNGGYILSYIAMLGLQIQPILIQREGCSAVDYFCQKPPPPISVVPQRWDSRVTGPL